MAGQSLESVISLPRGGGAVKGLGETFSPDLHTGTASFTVPMALPPGRNGFQPELTLGYSTGAGNGPFGLGWTLGVGTLSRRTERGVPVYDDDVDTFLLDSQELVEVDRSGADRSYRPRTEGAFARIRHVQSQGSDYWEVGGRDGTVAIYGTPRPQSAPLGWLDPSTLVDPKHTERIFSWHLSEVRDTFGNRIVYQYDSDGAAGGARRSWHQLYLSRVRYVDFSRPDGSEHFLIDVRFDYDDRPDPFSTFRQGFEVRTRKRCHKVRVHTHDDRQIQVRTYAFNYHANPQKVPANGVSLLSSVELVGHDGSEIERLAPTTFDYTSFEPSRRDLAAASGPDLPALGLSDPNLELVDLFGNGLPDILEVNGSARYWRNLGAGRFDRPRTVKAAPVGLQLSDPDVQILDADGDGRADLKVNKPELSGYFPLDLQGGFDRASFKRHAFAPNVAMTAPENRLVDLTGDGVTDLLRTGVRFECFFSDPERGWHRTRHVERRKHESFPDVSFSDPRVRTADMTGDGLNDIVFIHDGDVEYWPNLGHGNWGPRIRMSHGPRLPLNYDPARLLLGDLDGDGSADLIYVDHGKVLVWLNQSGNRFGDVLEIRGTPALHSNVDVRLADLYGNGVQGVLWSTAATENPTSRLHFLDFTGGTKPYLLNRVNNQIGAVTEVIYESSIRQYLRDEQHRDSQWKTSLPFPVLVVVAVRAHDLVSQTLLTTRFRYHHGHWDREEREFRGFGRVEQLDSETAQAYFNEMAFDDDTATAGSSAAMALRPERFAPPSLKRVWFHQGREHGFEDEYWTEDPPALEDLDTLQSQLASLLPRHRRAALRTLRGQVLRTELYGLDGSPLEGRPYTVTENLPGLREESAPPSTAADRARVFFAFQLATRTSEWDRGTSPMTGFSLSLDHDSYGLARTEVAVAVPKWRRRNFVGVPSHDATANAAPPSERAYLAKVTRTSYAQRDVQSRYMVDRVASRTVFELIEDLTTLPWTRLAVIEAALGLRGNAGAPLRVVSHELRYYDGPAYVGEPLGLVGDYGAVSRLETLALTDELVRDVYGANTPAELSSTGPASWPPGTPDEYRQFLPGSTSPSSSRGGLAPTSAGYGRATGTGAALAQTAGLAGYYVASERRRYDFQGPGHESLGLTLSLRDARGFDVVLGYDHLRLLPTTVTDALGLETGITYDPRVLQPTEVVDPNGNRSRFSYTSLGMLGSASVMGRPGQTVGDTDEQPGRIYLYDLEGGPNADGTFRPPSVQTLERTLHRWQIVEQENQERRANGQSELSQSEIDALFTIGQNGTDELARFPDRFIQTVEYSDGFGRLIQRRRRAATLNYEAPSSQPGVSARGVLPIEKDNTRDQRPVRARPGVVPVLVEEWKRYDNKGNVIESYEPFAAEGFDFSPPTDAELGASVLTFYDSRQRVVQQINPDGSIRREIYGVPTALDMPDDFVPSPWESFRYDENDNAGRTHSNASAGYSDHWNTPTSERVDARGRTIETIERLGSDAVTQAYRTRFSYDTADRLVEVTDTLGRRVFEHSFDLQDQMIASRSLDAGSITRLFDAAGLEVRRTEPLAVVLQAHDPLGRAIRSWQIASGQSTGSRTRLVLRIEYGDAGDPAQLASARAQARSNNQLQRAVKVYDGAGLLENLEFDHKGNAIATSRRVVAPDWVINTFEAQAGASWTASAVTLDWQPAQGVTLGQHAGALLDTKIYRLDSTYDALGRTMSRLLPADATGQRREAGYSYDEQGNLRAVNLDSNPVLRHTSYNARGQRLMALHGNGLATRYAYDPQTFRLARLRTEPYRVSATESDTLELIGSPLQDLQYHYDLVGNVVGIVERVAGCGVRNNPDAASTSDAQLQAELAAGDALLRRATYDPLYRLSSATGRECAGSFDWRTTPDAARCGFGARSAVATRDNSRDLTRTFGESYQYDAASNLTRVRHQAGSGAWVHHYGFGGLSSAAWQALWQSRVGHSVWNSSPGSPVPGNRVTVSSAADDTTTASHLYDASGHLSREGATRQMLWDASHRLRVFADQTSGNEPSRLGLYFYDGSGDRILKVVRHQGGEYQYRVYIDGDFEDFRWAQRTAGADQRHNSRLNVNDDEQLLVVQRVGTAHPDDGGDDLEYLLGDHLGSVSLSVDGTGQWLHREEYSPYGATVYGGYARKRYRYSGKERDTESGLYDFGARHYAPWLGRFVSCEPIFRLDTEAFYEDGLPHNLYLFSNDNPLTLRDEGGLAAKNFAIYLSAKAGKRYKSKSKRRKEKLLGKYARSLQKDGYTPLEVDSMEDLLTQLNERVGPLDTVGEVVFVTHAAPVKHRVKGPGRKSKLVRAYGFWLPSQQAFGTRRRVWNDRDVLERTAADPELGPLLGSLQEKTDPDTVIDFRSCNIGKSKDAMLAVSEFFGGVEVRATKYTQRIESRGKEDPVLVVKRRKNQPKGIPFDSPKAQKYKVRVRSDSALKTSDTKDVDLGARGKKSRVRF